MFVLGCYFQQFQGFILKLVARDFGHRKCVQVSLILAHIGTLILMNPFLQMNWSIIYAVDSPHVWFVTLVISDESPLIFPKENGGTWVLMIYLLIPEGFRARQVPCLCRANEASTCRGVLEGRHLNHHVSPCLPRLSLRMFKGDFGDWLCWFDASDSLEKISVPHAQVLGCLRVMTSTDIVSGCWANMAWNMLKAIPTKIYERLR